MNQGVEALSPLTRAISVRNDTCRYVSISPHVEEFPSTKPYCNKKRCVPRDRNCKFSFVVLYLGTREFSQLSSANQPLECTNFISDDDPSSYCSASKGIRGPWMGNKQQNKYTPRPANNVSESLEQ